MAGLLDFLNTDEGIMGLGLGLLAAAAPSMAPMNLAGRLAQAGQNIQGMQQRQRAQADEGALRRKLEQMQLESAQKGSSNETALRGLQNRFFTPGSPGLAGTADVNSRLPADLQIGALPPRPAVAPRFDLQGYAREAVRQGLMTPLQSMQLLGSQMGGQPGSLVRPVPMTGLQPD